MVATTAARRPLALYASSSSSSTSSPGRLIGIMWSVSISRYRQASLVFAYSAARQADPTLESVTVPLDRGLEVSVVLR